MSQIAPGIKFIYVESVTIDVEEPFYFRIG